MAEQIGFLTIDPIELQKITDDLSPLMMAKGIRGFVHTPMLRYLDLYEFIFGRPATVFPHLGKNSIYLMFSSKTNLVKIGRSKNPSFREKTLKVKNRKSS